MEGLTAQFLKTNTIALTERDCLDRHHAKVRETNQKNLEQSLAVDEEVAAMVTTVLANEAQIAQFEARLAQYEEATVKALMKNQQQLDGVQSDLDEQLDNAHRLDDGTIVFDTRDGTKVYDEQGQLLTQSSEELGFRGDEPKWEDFHHNLSRKQALELERDRILEFQDKTDLARERLDEGELTEDALADLEADLEESLPASVAEFMPDHEPQPQLDLKSQFASPAAPGIDQFQANRSDLSSVDSPAPAPGG